MKYEMHYLGVILHIIGIIGFTACAILGAILGLRGEHSIFFLMLLYGFSFWLGLAIIASILNLLHNISQSLQIIANQSNNNESANNVIKQAESENLDEAIWL